VAPHFSHLCIDEWGVQSPRPSATTPPCAVIGIAPNFSGLAASNGQEAVRLILVRVIRNAGERPLHRDADARPARARRGCTGRWLPDVGLGGITRFPPSDAPPPAVRAAGAATNGGWMEMRAGWRAPHPLFARCRAGGDARGSEGACQGRSERDTDRPPRRIMANSSKRRMASVSSTGVTG
jgi:hypothetical protein